MFSFYTFHSFIDFYVRLFSPVIHYLLLQTQQILCECERIRLKFMRHIQWICMFRSLFLAFSIAKFFAISMNLNKIQIKTDAKCSQCGDKDSKTWWHNKFFCNCLISWCVFVLHYKIFSAFNFFLTHSFALLSLQIN